MRKFGRGETLLQLINRDQFNELVLKWNIDKGVRKLTTWEQTCTHVMACLMRLESLREVEASLGVPRSTFSDANARRCSGFFEDLCDILLQQIQLESRDRRVKRALKQLFVLDSTECRVHGSLSHLPRWHLRSSPRETKKASLKIQTIWNVGGEWIDDFRTTPNRASDCKACLKFQIKPGRVYIFDKGYFDIRFWWKIVESKSHFVTRLKESPARRKLTVQVLRENPDKDGVLWEGTCSRSQGNLLRLPKQARGIQFRHIIYRDPETKKVFDFATSDFDMPANRVAELYKMRWGVEILFRWLKSNLKIRYFACKNVNAIEIQVAIAVLVRLLVQLLKIRNQLKLSLSQCLRKLRTALLHEGLCRSHLRDTIDSNYFARAGSTDHKEAG